MDLNEIKSTKAIIKSVRMKSAVADIIGKMANEENRNFSNMVETILLNVIKENYGKNLQNRAM